ncbi:transcriptional regulator [Actinokineospora fastidiosa]|uniref:Uncharacterized protein n=1 Tax=Actinokineospora fastidiosa TaxID=1816 RepID=A0A918GB67_9PSEU|nr:transcriptional regulator [Actinokineospora fastidiosa]GGS28271.1 hypothetical protein GCM10010171_21530 [Actinokineospora fastidiosa]
MHPVNGWTGRTACALQSALRMSNEAFAAHLGIATRTVGGWHQKPTVRPKSEMQQLLDAALDRASDDARSRFAQLTGSAPATEATDAELRLLDDPDITAALDWLDQHAGWEPGGSRHAVAVRLARLDLRELQDRRARRTRVSQRDLADALAAYYGASTTDHGRYTARVGDQAVQTSVLTHPDWLDLDCPLIPQHDRLTVVSASPDAELILDVEASDPAIERLAAALAMRTRLINNPLYQLHSIDIAKGRIGGSASVAHFVQYALTMDLLEGELTDALASGLQAVPGSLPLRDRYLPNLASVVDISTRLCAGGALALTAIARPADPFRGEPDYLLLVQERSGHVLNANRRLAVIPKGFHQPLADVRADAQIGVTLRREMEEELFGRDDVDSTVTSQRSADPLHPSRLSEPMRWLTESPGRLRMECTGFGLNLVSGNYEFASLIVIEDEEFWDRFGGMIEANWESSSLRRYSTTDTDLLTELITDVAWSNEGLFAMTQGLHRLAEIGGPRVKVPPIEWEIRR